MPDCVKFYEILVEIRDLLKQILTKLPDDGIDRSS